MSRGEIERRGATIDERCSAAIDEWRGAAFDERRGAAIDDRRGTTNDERPGAAIDDRRSAIVGLELSLWSPAKSLLPLSLRSGLPLLSLSLSLSLSLRKYFEVKMKV